MVEKQLLNKENKNRWTTYTLHKDDSVDSTSEEKNEEKSEEKESDNKSDKKADVTDKEDTPMIKPNYEKNMKIIGNRLGYERNRII